MFWLRFTTQGKIARGIFFLLIKIKKIYRTNITNAAYITNEIRFE
jgi:hypothetical protein